MFSKDTIMGQILFQVKMDQHNQNYVEAIRDLIYKIDDKEYLDKVITTWTSNGLIITDRALTKKDLDSLDKEWVYVETPHISEYSWLVSNLNDIFSPLSKKDKFRLFTTIGFLFNLYTDKYNSLDEILGMTAKISTIWLHPDHVGSDRFVVHPVNLPDFGEDF